MPQGQYNAQDPQLSGKSSHSMLPNWVQVLCPAPKRLLQQLVLREKLTSGLDVGCGPGSLLTALRGPNFFSVGIDVHLPTIEAAKRQALHDEYVTGDFLKYSFSRRFDVVVLSHVIEHFPRDIAMDVLRKAESLAARIVYVETPHGFLEQVPEDGNEGQRHLSGWFPHDFESRGYTVFGAGAMGLTGPMGRAAIFPESVTRLMQRATQWYFFRRPAKAATIAAIRYVDETQNVRQL